MTERRTLAILAFLLALIGGLLVIVNALNVRFDGLTLDRVARLVLDLVLGVAAIFGGVMMYQGKMSTGGLVTIVIGVVILLVSQGLGVAAVLVIVGGVLGIVGSEARR